MNSTKSTTILTREKKAVSQERIKYISALDYLDQTLIALSATRAGVSIIYFVAVTGTPAGITSASFTLFFFFANRNNKKTVKNKKINKKKNHNKILMLANSKLNSTETLISPALIHLEISLEEFITIVKEKDI